MKPLLSFRHGPVPAAAAVVLAMAVFACGGTGGDLPETVEFNRHIRPILSNKCFTCHGPDPGTREADLRLDLQDVSTARRDGYERPAIVRGDPSASELVYRIHASDPDVRMPPPDTREPLTDRERDLLKRWIEQGAEWQPHWFYVAPVRREPPSTTSPTRNDVDRFIAARLEKDGLHPSQEAGAAELVRRLSFDLVGLPPDSGLVATYLADRRDGSGADPGSAGDESGDAGDAAYARLVDTLLASPHYGERMAMMWLDLVRYADTDGYHSDLHRNVSAYRGYVIGAFNANKPFDQFTREQLAGDLLPHATAEQLVAAGFNRLGQATKEGGAQPKEYLAKYAGDRVRTVSTAWMGSTVGCAECHDHKFDPFTQADFYRMAAFFADVKEKGVWLNSNRLDPEMPLPNREEARRIEAMNRQIQEARRRNAPVQTVLARREELLAEIPHVLATRQVEPRTMRLLRRGNWQDNGGPIVEPAVPSFLPAPTPTSRRATRLDLADWLVSPDNPLTARVFVNHLWARFFGNGLSRVLDDLGSQGEWPSHPDLLDWLAVEFIESGWDVKHMVRLIVTSSTYRRSSRATDAHRDKDPENRLLARQSRFRLDAEMIRDNALAVSGLLNKSIGGESVKPYQPDGYWSEIQTFGADGPAATWNASAGADQYRRGLYTYWKRSFLHPAMLAFDAPDRQECTARRARSNTPLQALVLLNDPSFVEAAQAFGHRIVREGGAMPAEKVQWAFWHALSRKATADELQEMDRLFRQEFEWYTMKPDEAVKLTARTPIDPPENKAELAAWTAVARALFNTHEFVTRY